MFESVSAITITGSTVLVGMRLFHTESSDWSDKIMPQYTPCLHYPPVVSPIRIALSVPMLINPGCFGSAPCSCWPGRFPLYSIFDCSGSTAGGMKIFRFQVAAGMSKAQLRFLMHPNGVFSLRYNKKPVTEDITRGVIAFTFFFFFYNCRLALSGRIVGIDA